MNHVTYFGTCASIDIILSLFQDLMYDLITKMQDKCSGIKNVN